MSCTSNQDMDAVVDTFETVSLALSISSGMVAEGFPVVNLSQHGVGVICNIPLRIAQNPIKEKVFIFRTRGESQTERRTVQRGARYRWL
jgi:hypothetical protein